MTNEFELPNELLSQVVIRTVELNSLTNNIIRIAFGLKLKFGTEADHYRSLNLREIQRFDDFFLENLGSSSRADILLEIVKDVSEVKTDFSSCKDFKNKMINFYKIRNIFAHNMYPKGLDGKSKLDSSVPNWEELNQKHKELYNELMQFFIQLNTLLNMKSILVDGMDCLYDEKFCINKPLLELLQSFPLRKILVVNGFREKARKILEGNGFAFFSLEEEGIKKDNPLYFQRLFQRYQLAPSDVLYFDHSLQNVGAAKALGIQSTHYTGDLEAIKSFLGSSPETFK